MKAKITVAVEDYRPSYANWDNQFVLQSPISPEKQNGGRILVRQDRGTLNNEVIFKGPEELVKLDNGSKSAYAHGILLRSDSSKGHREGDQIWLTDAATGRPADGIPAYNLRTWKSLNVALHDVCWIPKYRALDCGEDMEELLTISGPTVRGKRAYVLAVVQRLRSRDHIVNVEAVDLKEIAQRDLMKYYNLTAAPDGRDRIGSLFRRSLHSVRPDTFSNDDTDEESDALSSIRGSSTDPGSSRAASLTPSSPNISEEASMCINIDISLDEPRDDSNVERRYRELEREVMANLTNLSQGPDYFIRAQPKRVCNVDNCITPPQIFCHTNTPSLENLHPKHHHREDHECSRGARHTVHCVFQFRKNRNGIEVLDKTSCIIPPFVRHMCCETNAQPFKRYCRPTTVEQVGRAGVIRQGGDFSVASVLEDDYSDLPVEVERMSYMKELHRDLHELGQVPYVPELSPGLLGLNMPDLDLDGLNMPEVNLDDLDRDEPKQKPYMPDLDLDGLDKNSPEYMERADKAEMSAQSANSHYSHSQQQQQELPIRGSGVRWPSSSFASMYSPWDAQAGLQPVGSVSRPIVVHDDNEAEDEPEVFGDWGHFSGDEMDLDE